MNKPYHLAGMVKVSVIITTFNSANTISRTLSSVMNQEGIGTLFTLELIVVDDCSTDSTADIIAAYGLSSYYTTQSNSGGPNRGRNIGLRNATGDYICFLDHDDTWHPQKLKFQLQAARYAPIVTCGYDVSNTHTGLRQEAKTSGQEVTVFQHNHTFLNKLARAKKSLQHTYLSALMVHKSLKHIHFEEHFGMLDYDWLLRLFENQVTVEVNKTLVSRFVNGSNLSLNPEYRKRDYYYSLMSLEMYEKKYPREVTLARRRINGSRGRYWYLMGEMGESRKYFLKAMPGTKEVLYYVTSFLGSRWVKRNFVIFG